jgi:hypothetical protein
MKLSGGIFLLLLLSAVSLGGCMAFHGAGPCYGVGCGAFSAPSGSAPAAAQSNADTGKKPRRARKLLKKIKL